jgi:hypothetical protein
MSAYAGPQIADDGLVFYYDMGNPQKSWKGKPTTNLIDVSENLLDVKWTKEGGFGTVTANYGNAPDGTKTSTRLQYSSGYFYRSTTTSPAITALTAGTTVTFSCWVKGAPQSGRGIGLWSYAVGGIVAASNQSINQSSWTRVSLTYTIAAGATSFAIMLAGAPGNIFQGDIEVWRPQLEVGTFATPFVNGTRSNTQAILDLTNNNTITASSLTYSSDGLFTLGSSGNDYISIASAALNGRTSWTVDFWMQRDITNSIDTFLTCGAGNDFLWFFEASSLQYQNTASSSVTYPVTNSVPFHFAATGSGGLITVYKNGQVIGTMNNNTNITVTSTLGIVLGQEMDSNTGAFDANQSWKGRLFSCKFYNRALTSAEVQQNFNALKGRYFGYQSVMYTASANMTLTNNGTQDVTMFKTSDNNSWNGEVRSTESFSAPCTIEFSKQSGTTDNLASYLMIGWNEDPTTNTSYTSIDHASYPYQQNSYVVYNNGGSAIVLGPWDQNKRFYIVYDTDGFIRHYNGSTLLYSANYGTNKTVFVDSSFYSVNSTFGGLTNVKVARSSWNGFSYV